jgi:hypothetical protein
MSDVRALQPSKAQELWYTVLRWFDSWAGLEHMQVEGPPKMDWLRCIRRCPLTAAGRLPLVAHGLVYLQDALRATA